MRYITILVVGIITISTFSIYSQRTSRKGLSKYYKTDSCLINDSIPITTNQPVEIDSTVYICTGSSSKCFHSTRDCKGLNNCNGTIKALKVSKASKKRRKCKICFKKR